MNWLRIMLEVLSMSLLFNAVVVLGFFLVPQAYSKMSLNFGNTFMLRLLTTLPSQDCFDVFEH